MPDSFTTSLGLLLMATGGNDNLWGENLNQQVIQYVEDALVGRTSIATTGGSYGTLTTAQARSRFIDVSGALSSDATITVPDTKNSWLITNNCTGDYGVLFQVAGGNKIGIPAGTTKEVWCNGSGVITRADAERVGVYFFHAGSAAPAGAFECLGGTKLLASYPDLGSKLGTLHGGNGTTTFGLPDGYTSGKFLRSRTASVAAGTSQTDDYKSHNHTASASTTLSIASDGSHSHTYSGTTANGGVDHTHNYYDYYPTLIAAQSGGGSGGWNALTQAYRTTEGASAYLHDHTYSGTTSASSTHAHSGSTAATSVTVNSNGGTETRPTNIVGILCVWY